MRKKTVPALVLVLGLLLLLCACGPSDRPPDDGTPWPPDLEGVFTSDYGTLTFNGDGKSVTLDLTAEGAQLSGLPQGEQEAQYVFLFHSGSWRYDKAETFRIMIGEESYSFPNALGVTGEDTVGFYFPDFAEAVLFEKN